MHNVDNVKSVAASINSKIILIIVTTRLITLDCSDLSQLAEDYITPNPVKHACIWTACDETFLTRKSYDENFHSHLIVRLHTCRPLPPPPI